MPRRVPRFVTHHCAVVVASGAIIATTVSAIVVASAASGDLQPGQMVPSIVTVSQEYGLAKTTVRKALDILKADGPIVTRPSWGTFVAEKH